MWSFAFLSVETKSLNAQCGFWLLLVLAFCWRMVWNVETTLCRFSSFSELEKRQGVVSTF
jgi:hypothetical protein